MGKSALHEVREGFEERVLTRQEEVDLLYVDRGIHMKELFLLGEMQKI